MGDKNLAFKKLESCVNIAFCSLILQTNFTDSGEGKKSGSCASESGEWEQDYELELTNFEVKAMFRKMIRKWFGGAAHGYNDGGKGAFRYG